MFSLDSTPSFDDSHAVLHRHAQEPSFRFLRPFGTFSFPLPSSAPETSDKLLIKMQPLPKFVKTFYFFNHIIIHFYCQSAYSSLLTEISYAVRFCVSSSLIFSRIPGSGSCPDQDVAAHLKSGCISGISAQQMHGI